MRRGVILGLRVLAVAVVVAAGVYARASAGDVPSPTTVRGTTLDAIDCDAAPCVAVGSAGSVYSVLVPLVVRSGPGPYAAEPAPIPTRNGDSILTSVSCSGPSTCMAVGRADVPTPYFGARSSGGRPVATSWDGRAWRLRPPGVPHGTRDAGLHSVSCAGATCVAVGSYQRASGNDRALAETWDGTRWALAVPEPIRHTEDTVLRDIACVSPTDCTAVGRFGYEVAGLASGAAPLVERWDGTAWRADRAVNPSGSADTELDAVSCPSPDACVAVGFRRHTGGVYATLAEVWNGRRWALTDTPDPKGSPDTEFADVACPSPDRCIAVGSTVTNGRIVTFAETWNGARWRIERTPAPPGTGASAFTAVSCSGPSTCRAVGASRRTSPVGDAFAATWADGRWSFDPVPQPRASA